MKKKMKEEFNTPPKNGALYIKHTNKWNFKHLIPLVSQQAEHHDTTFRGYRDAFHRALFKDTPAVPKTFFVMAPDTEEPLAYVLYTEVFTNKGKALYMEDICTRKTDRGSQGHKSVGSFAFAHMVDLAHEKNCNRIIWVVAENNAIARSFYNKKIGAHYLPETNFDMGHLLNKKALPPQPPSVKAAVATPYDIKSIVRLAGITPCPFRQIGAHLDDHVASLKEAAQSDTALVFVARDTATDAILGYSIANANYSSFRTVMGLELEDAVFDDTLTQQQQKDVMRAMLRAAVDYCHEKNWTGHLCFLTDDHDPLQAKILRDLGGSPLKMTDNPDSRFLLMGIGADKLKPHFSHFLRNGHGPANDPSPKL